MKVIRHVEHTNGIFGFSFAHIRNVIVSRYLTRNAVHEPNFLPAGILQATFVNHWH